MNSIRYISKNLTSVVWLVFFAVWLLKIIIVLKPDYLGLSLITCPNDIDTLSHVPAYPLFLLRSVYAIEKHSLVVSKKIDEISPQYFLLLSVPTTRDPKFRNTWALHVKSSDPTSTF